MHSFKQKTAYDQIPYESKPFPQTHPDNLATIGRLFGMAPQKITQCRVLELGCAGGGNLIPMAFYLPESEFIGVDASIRQIETGRKTIQNLGLDNIHLEHRDILDLDGAMGKFDYIIAHGVYSWVPEAVQEKILCFAADHLAPQGIAFVSYNVYPGWHMREMIRDMMLYHVEPFDTPEDQIEQARALLDFLTNSVPTDNNYYGMMLKSELELIRSVKDWYLYHDHLEEFNSPIYFHQFDQHARRHGLQYLGEADFSTMLSMTFSKEIETTLNRISPDIIKSEQYMDFIRNRQFRQTLLCHGSISLKRKLEATDAASFLMSSSARPLSNTPNLMPDIPISFETNTGLTIETPSPITKAALLSLNKKWPRAVDLSTLQADVTAMLAQHYVQTDAGDDEIQGELLKEMLHCYARKVVEFHTWQADYLNDINEYPKVSRLAAYMAKNSTMTINHRHETVILDPVAHRLISLLNGTKDRSQILAALIQLVTSNDLVVKQGDMPLKDSDQIEQAIEKVMENTLDFFCQLAMLAR